jgi:hypothetical protein
MGLKGQGKRGSKDFLLVIYNESERLVCQLRIDLNKLKEDSEWHT